MEYVYVKTSIKQKIMLGLYLILAGSPFALSWQLALPLMLCTYMCSSGVPNMLHR